MTTKKGQTNVSKKVAKVNKTQRPTKNEAISKGNAGVRPSTQAIRRTTDRPVRVSSQSVEHSHDDDAVFRAKATAVAERAARQNAIRELREANKLSIGQWVAVTIFLLALIAGGVLIGKVAA